MHPRSLSTGFRRVLAAAVMVAGFVLTRATADDRLSGYWVPAPNQPDLTAFSIGQLGKWTMVTPHWGGANGTSPETTVRYLATTEGNHGTLSADQNLDHLPAVPRSISYRIEGGQLTLTVADSVHAGTYELIKGTPPSPPAAAPIVDMKRLVRPAPPAQPVKQDFPWRRLLGSWSTQPQSGTQINLFIAPSKTVGVFKVNQRWIHGSDNPSLSQGGNYTGSMQGSQAVLTRDKPDFDGSPIPLALTFNFEGDNLYLTVSDGPYAGRYQLVAQARNQRNPGE